MMKILYNEAFYIKHDEFSASTVVIHVIVIVKSLYIIKLIIWRTKLAKNISVNSSIKILSNQRQNSTILVNKSL